MGVAAEPGQKGVNWSNIAVGKSRHGYSPQYRSLVPRSRWYHEHGMVSSQLKFFVY